MNSGQLLQFDDMATRQSSFLLKSRRYIGSKTKLTGFIKTVVAEKCEDVKIFSDLFAGTGSVSQAFNDSGTVIMSNDHLLCNYYALQTFLAYSKISKVDVAKKINHLNNLKPDLRNYFSLRYGGTYFTNENARKIGTVREEIEKISAGWEKAALVTSLIYAIDRVANTVGHYDAYRRPLDNTVPIKLKVPQLENPLVNQNNIVTHKDANKLASEIKADVVYLDPPYNSRQYCDAYHLLENVAAWKKPKTFGKAHKMNRSSLKSRYCQRDAAEALSELVTCAKCRYIILSYNNTGNSRDIRSNARIKDDEIMRILKKRGDVKIFERPYKIFSSGKSSSITDHTERLFLCKVRA